MIRLAAVGRLKSGPEADLVADYARRAMPLARALGFGGFALREVEAPKSLDGAQRQAREGALLLEAAAGSGMCVAFDERGDEIDSAGFANRLAGWRDNGVGTIAFLIGGADGLSSGARDACRMAISFGRMTWPHMLARTMACEQIYRAMTILAGHPYHRS